MLRQSVLFSLVAVAAGGLISSSAPGHLALRSPRSSGLCSPNLALRGGGAEPQALDPKLVLQCENTLGEAPLWNSEEETLYWLDINGQKLWKFKPSSGESKSWELPEKSGSFAFVEGGGFLMGFNSGLCFYDPETGDKKHICNFEDGLNTRPNDSKVDKDGNFVIGSYNNNHREDKKNIGGLWRLNAKDLTLEEILDYRFRCSNTIAFSKTGEEIYFCDTPTREIYKFKYSPTGKLEGKTLFWKMSEEDKGGPDGATCDDQGGLWEAHAGNWKVVRHRPEDGQVDYEVKLPFNNPTSCAIGGDTLYITTARHRLSEEERAQQPGAGQLWAVKLPEGIRGISEPKFKGHA